MATVWKFPIELADNFSLDMPKDAEVLFVNNQHGAPQMWARVTPENPMETRRFQVRGTGDHNPT